MRARARAQHCLTATPCRAHLLFFLKEARLLQLVVFLDTCYRLCKAWGRGGGIIVIIVGDGLQGAGSRSEPLR